jgi:signal transduction histidine kinase
MNDQLVRLEQAFEEMYRFTANAAHELQTPLTVLRGHVDVALRRTRTPQAYQETLSLLGLEIDKLTRMVRSLLTLARLDREARVLPDESVDLVRLVELEAEPFEKAARSKGLDFRLDVPNSAVVRGQEDLLREVAANVLDNAVKYTPDGYLEVEIVPDGSFVQLSVRDTGIGMTGEDSVHATDRFYRASSVDTLDIPGSGLGLSLAAQIVARHGGELRIDSVPNKGTCVCIRLPVAD